MMKKLLSIVLVFVMIFTATPVSALNTAVDERIFTDRATLPGLTLTGRPDGVYLIQNLDFTDVPATHWAAEAIARTGSLGLIRGSNRAFSPAGTLSNQDAVALIIRLMGQENLALAEAINIQDDFFGIEGIGNLWALGHISHANNIGIITEDEYFSMIFPIANDPLAATAPVTRERVARWVAEALNRINPGALQMAAPIQRVMNFTDWNDINIEYLQAVEALARANIMQGSDGRFNPRGSLTRAEMAQILRNTGEIYNPPNNIERRTGTVGGIRDGQMIGTGTTQAARHFYIRTAAGLVDIIQYQLGQVTGLADTVADAVVFREGRVTGLLNGLTPGDQIEYLIDTATNEVIYIQVVSPGLTESFVVGRLYSVDAGTSMIALQDDARTLTTFAMASGLIENEQLIIDLNRTPLDDLPLGSEVRLRLLGNVVDTINIIGTPIVVNELRGIVVENNFDFGYMIIFDNNGNLVTRSFFADDIRIQRQNHWDVNDDIGYISQVFPDFRHNPRTAFIEDIRPGDIVFLRFDDLEDPERITNLSAATNYAVRYGQVQQITRGMGVSSFLVEFENRQTTWFDVADNVFVSAGGRPVRVDSIVIGDWAQFLISQAIMEPGHVLESVREIVVEGGASHISTIVRGQLAGIAPVQRELMVQNAQTLERVGWTNYRNIMPLSIAANDIEFFHNGRQISLDYAQRFLRRTDGEVYIALDSHPNGHRVRRVTFRDGRDELLPPDTVLNSTGAGSFTIISNPGDITTDPGTIVRRHGRLVPHHTILPWDHAMVSLNDGFNAAVVDIVDAPDTSGISLARGRVLSYEAGRGFRVQSMSAFSGNSWQFTPIQREFTIDHNTLFVHGGGAFESAVNYLSQMPGSGHYIDRVFTIVYEGSRAVRIVEAPFAQFAVRGTVVSSGGITELRDVEYMDNATGRWLPIGLRDTRLAVAMNNTAVVIRNNTVVTESDIRPGDSVRIFTNSLPMPIVPGQTQIAGLLAFVDR